MMNFNLDSLANHLKGIENTWVENEWAMLFSNSITDMNIRVKFNLQFAHLLSQNDDYFIQREWYRTDLAVIHYEGNETRPSALFEFKARHTYFIGKGTGYNTLYGDGGKKNGVLQDIEKLSSYSDDIPKYTVLIGVHPLEEIPQKYEVFNKDCKEISQINKSFKKYNSERNILDRCHFNVQRFCEDNNQSVMTFEYDIGSALEVNWKMVLWILYNK